MVPTQKQNTKGRFQLIYFYCKNLAFFCRASYRVWDMTRSIALSSKILSNIFTGFWPANIATNFDLRSLPLAVLKILQHWFIFFHFNGGLQVFILIIFVDIPRERYRQIRPQFQSGQQFPRVFLHYLGHHHPVVPRLFPHSFILEVMQQFVSFIL